MATATTNSLQETTHGQSTSSVAAITLGSDTVYATTMATARMDTPGDHS